MPSGAWECGQLLMFGPKWPPSGEMDIIEGANGQKPIQPLSTHPQAVTLRCQARVIIHTSAVKIAVPLEMVAAWRHGRVNTSETRLAALTAAFTQWSGLLTAYRPGFSLVTESPKAQRLVHTHTQYIPPGGDSSNRATISLCYITISQSMSLSHDSPSIRTIYFRLIVI